MLSERFVFFFFSSRRRHTRLQGDWSSDVLFRSRRRRWRQRRSRRCTAGALRDRRSLRTLSSDVARRRAEWAPTLDDRTDGIEQPQRAMPIAEPEKLCHVRLARVAIYWEIRETLLRQRLDGFADRHRLCNSPELERASLVAREHPRLPRQRDPHVWKQIGRAHV